MTTIFSNTSVWAGRHGWQRARFVYDVRDSKTNTPNAYKDDTYPTWHCVVWYFKPGKTA